MIPSMISRRRFGASVVTLAAVLAARPALVLAASDAMIGGGVDVLLAQMTLDEKCAQLVGVWNDKSKLQDAHGQFSASAAAAAFPNGLGQITRPGDRVGSVVGTVIVDAGAKAGQLNRGPREAATYARDAQAWARKTRLGIPLILHEEALHGFVARAATSFPQAIALASTWDPALVEQVFAVAAREMRARGINLALAPVVDVARDPRWGRSEETYGEDPHLVGEIGLAAVRGLQGTTLPLGPDKVFATLKHLAGHGQPENGTNTGPAPYGEHTLREVFLAPFERIVRTLPIRSVMPSYNEIDGVPSHVNTWLLTDVLRGEWGFQGIAVSDYYAIAQLVDRHKVANDLDDAGVRSLTAGCDAELPDPAAFARLPELVKSGKIPVALIDRAVRRMLRVKIEGGLFEAPLIDPERAEAATATPSAIALARTAATRAMVLLKNDGILPLDPKSHKRLLVVGTHARDTPIGGYSEAPRRVVSVLEGLQAEQGFEVRYAEGVRLTRGHVWEQDKVEPVPRAENLPLIAEAVAAAKDADAIVVVLGENEQLSREAWADEHLGDRDSLDLFGEQSELALALFATGKPVVVLLLNGRPLTVPVLAEKANAILEGWYLGQETGHGVADVLVGRVSPGGKLPVTMPRSVGQLPIYYNYKPSARRGYLFGETKPLFPFGFGLSYTQFEIGTPRLVASSVAIGQPVEVLVDVANVGKRIGDEVVQLYLRDQVASVTRPVLELKRFERVTLRPGERRTLRFLLERDDFSFYNMEMLRVVEPGAFDVMAGPNSAELKSAVLVLT